MGGINRNGVRANHVQQVIRLNGIALLQAVKQLHDQHNRQQGEQQRNISKPQYHGDSSESGQRQPGAAQA